MGPRVPGSGDTGTPFPAHGCAESMEARHVVVALVLMLVPWGGVAATPGISECDGATVHTEQPQLLHLACDSGEIRPGAKANGCTLNFVMTDATDLYIGTAGHCGGVGKRWSMAGIGGFGTTIFREFDGSNLLAMRDWGLILIDREDHGHVNPTMYRFGGPWTPVDGVESRAPIPGDGVVLYGNGAGFGQEDAGKARASAVGVLLGDTAFGYAGTVGGGDSGSPVRFATGEPAGIAVAGGITQTGDMRGYVPGRCWYVDDATGGASDACLPYRAACAETEGACDAPLRAGNLYPLVVVTRFDAALAAFEGYLGHSLTVVDGDVLMPAVDAGLS